MRAIQKATQAHDELYLKDFDFIECEGDDDFSISTQHPQTTHVGLVSDNTKH